MPESNADPNLETTEATRPKNASELRHGLRTPLNHIIGYGEMVLEDLNPASGAAAHQVLSTMISNARELVHFIQNTLNGDGNEANPQRIRDLQLWLSPYAKQLHQDADSLIASGPEEFRKDFDHLLDAADRLVRFTKGDTGALTDAVQVATEILPAPAGVGSLLVVDDNSGNREILARQLSRQGYGVVTCSDGEQALDLIQRQPFDLVLLDVMMPGLDGFEVLKRLKANPALRSIPVIVISALDESGSVVNCIQMGAEDYMMKPFDPVLLNARISACLEKKRLRDEESRHAAALEEAVDQLRRTQDQLVMQERLASLGALTAGIAHEIKNPLNFVTNFADVARELLTQLGESIENKDWEDVRQLTPQLAQALDKVEEHGKRADRIVKGMLAHSRAPSGQSEPTDLNALLLECSNLAFHGLRAADKAFNVNFENALAPDLPKVDVVAQDISRVFLNVINNACYAANERVKKEPGRKAEVRLTTALVAGYVEIRIRDNGFGIPEEVRAKIFDPFFTTKPAGAGTGLGLSISYEIVRAHSGSITAESVQGEFAEFAISLPVRGTQANAR